MKFLRNFFRILKVSGKRYVSDELGQRAVVLTYYTLFSVVPVMALLFGIAKGFSLEDQLKSAVYSRFSQHEDIVEWIYRFAETTLRQASGSLVAGVGVIALLWTVVWLIATIEKSFNAVWGLPARKGLWRRFSDYIALVLMTPIMMVAVSTLGVLLRSKLRHMSDALPWGIGSVMADVGANLAPLLVVWVLLTLIYKFTPNTRVRWAAALAAGIIAGVLFQILQDGFIYLQRSVFSYNRIYGSFAALPLFLVWLNWSWQIILFGAELSFVWQHVDSGIFDDDRNQRISTKLRREHQLAIIRLVFQEFDGGRGAIPEAEVAAALKLPDIVLRNEIDELLDLNILSRVELAHRRMGLLPKVPPNKFHILEFIRRINGSGDPETPDFARFDALFARIEKALAESECNVNIHQI